MKAASLISNGRINIVKNIPKFNKDECLIKKVMPFMVFAPPYIQRL